MHPARAVVGGVHARPGYRLVAIHQVLAFAKRIQKNRHGADVQRMGTQPQQMIENPRDLIKHDPDVPGTNRHLEAHELFDGQHIDMLIAHHGNVVEAIHVADAVVVGLALCKLLRRAVQQTDMRVRPLYDLTLHFQDQPQDPVSRRVLGSEIHGVVAKLRHRSLGTRLIQSDSHRVSPWAR